MTDKVFLVGDIGGTNARFALVDPESPGYRDEMVLQCADHGSIEQAIESYLAEVSAPAPVRICLAAAGPVIEGGVNLTNNNWRIREHELAMVFSTSAVRLLNDFEAIAHSLLVLDESHCSPAGLLETIDLSGNHFTVGLIGPGTGLGAAGLLRRDGRTYPLISEAGHVGFAPENALQRAVWEVLIHRFGRVSDERLVSGSGIENIYTALSEIHSEPSQVLTVVQIFEQMHENQLASEAVNLFFEILGQVSGNFVLSLGAYDGLFIAGGIVQRYPELFANSAFRSAFENKGRHRHIMEQVPTLLIDHPHPGLLGAAVVAQQLAD